MASLAAPLADAAVNMFSTYDTDYVPVLVLHEKRIKAIGVFTI